MSLEIKKHEVVFDNNGIPDVYKAGIIRQGSKNVDMLSVRFENYNNMEMVAVLGGERADGEKVPPGLLFIPEKDEATGYVWYNFIFGQQEDEGNPNSWFTEIDGDLLLNIRLVKGKQVYVDSQIKMEVEYDSGFETGGEYGWNIVSGFLEALSMRATYDYVDSEIERVITDMVTIDNDLQAHKSDTSAHNIPSQIDSKINTHNQSGSSHQDLRTGLSEVQSVATSNKNKLDTIEVGATADQTPAEIKTAYESNANTNAFTDLDKTKLEQIEEQAQVNKIESIIVNGIEQAIIEKSVNLTTDIHDMIVEEIDKIVGGSPELLDTLQELANAIDNDPNFATTVTNEIASKVSKDFDKYTEKTTLTGSEYIVINDNGVIKRVLTDLIRNDKLTAENIPSGKGTTISEELDKKVDIDLIETQLPDNLVYSDDLEEVEEPIIQVYNSQLLNNKQESELNVNSAIKDGDNNVIAGTYYKKTDPINADTILQNGTYVNSEELSVAYAKLTPESEILSTRPLSNKYIYVWEDAQIGYGKNGTRMWTDGYNLYYYDQEIGHKVFNKKTRTWDNKAFTGLDDTIFIPNYVWTDGEEIYYSYNDVQKKLNTSTSHWENVPNGFIYGKNYIFPTSIWTDGNNLYYSEGEIQYILNKTSGRWEDMTWNGMSSFHNGVWTDGEEIYYSAGEVNKVLNQETSTWEDKIFENIGFVDNVRNIWTDGKDIFHSDGDIQKKLKRNTNIWEDVTWEGLDFELDGMYIWTDGENIYFSDKVLKKHKLSPKPILKGGS